MKYFSVGLMSGTSVDSIDAAVAEFELDESGQIKSRLIDAIGKDIPSSVRKTLFSLFENKEPCLDKITLLDRELAELFAEAANDVIKHSGLKNSDIAVIGSHGQTIWHIAGLSGSKNRMSLQIGNGAIIAFNTGIKTVCDFRTGDIAAGGTGAPLVPFFDKIVSSSFEKPVAFQNFGGIANVCFISKNDELLAFDTGPANMIVDRVVSEISNGQLHFDKDGNFGKNGKIIQELLEKWMKHPYFQKCVPKSTGREEFGDVFYNSEIKELIENTKIFRNEKFSISDCGQEVFDIVHTVEAFTAKSTAKAYRDFLPDLPKTVVVSGGGVRNPVIMELFQKELPSINVVSADSVGLSTDYKEAMAFALFGLLRLLEKANTEPDATGATYAVSSGALYLPNRF